MFPNERKKMLPNKTQRKCQTKKQALREAANVHLQFELVTLSPPAHTRAAFGSKILHKYLGYSLGHPSSPLVREHSIVREHIL